MLSTAALAAVRVAAGYGYRAEAPVTIQETNNTVVWLRPHEIVAKVGTRGDSEEVLLREHAVAQALAAGNAPIAPPIAQAEPTRDGQTGFVVTLWQRLEHERNPTVSPAAVGMSLRRLHEALARYEGALPTFRVGLESARATLADDRRMAALSRGDLSMLRVAFDRMLDQLSDHEIAGRPLHGEPHLGNLLVTASGLRWIDLEAACTGPLEWDLAHLPDGAVAAFPEADPELLSILRSLNSARVATWCWLGAEHEGMRRHGEYHLERIRSSMS